MGDENSLLTEAQARHLLRRSGFGARHKDVQTILNRYPTRGAAADWLLRFTPSTFRPAGSYIEAVHNSWIKYMVQSAPALQEKLVLFWHDHFATSNAKVDFAKLMANQNRLLRRFCKGNFKDFVKAINRDAAMMEFLDTVRNAREQPNENYARELQELFTLGVKDFNGNPNYAQEDIVQIARAFTGWTYNGKGDALFEEDPGNPNLPHHDYQAAFPERGPKVIYRTRGGFGAEGRDFTQPNGEGPAEIDQVVDIIFDHRDSEGKSTVARYVAGKLFTYFAQPYPKRPAQPALKPVVDELVAASNFDGAASLDTAWNIAAVVRAIFVHDAFYATAAPAPFDANDLKSVKWPIDYVVSTLRLLNVRLKSRYQYVNGGDYGTIFDLLTNMGQVLFEPPSVFGWNWETAWISSATLLARYQFARDVTAARASGATGFHPQKLIDLGLTDPGAIVDAVTDAVGVTDQLAAAQRIALVNYLTDNGAHASVDLKNRDTRDAKLNGLFALVLQSAAYQLH